MSKAVSKYAAVLAAAVLVQGLAGCGSGNKEGGPLGGDVPKVSETACAQCHSTAIDHIAGTSIYQAYLASSHFTNNFKQVGCQDCHGGGSQHNGVGPLPYPNPDAAGKCFACHTGHLPAAHFSNVTTSNVLSPATAMYVTKNYQNSCTSCHDPHLGNNGILDGKTSTLTGLAKGTQHKDWAASAHGDVNGVAWTHYDFKNRQIGGIYSCQRCHTSTGFIHYAESNFADPFPTTTWATPGDTGREVLTCKACHTDYNYKNRVRKAGAYTAPYGLAGLQQSVQFDDAATSNLCIPCHTGLVNEASINGISDFSNVSFAGINPHYLAAAGILYNKIGFRFYDDPVKYDPSLTFSTTHFAHKNIGVNNYLLPLPLPVQPTGYNGPCVSCHMTSGTHTLNIAQGYLDQSNGVCVKCHIVGSPKEMNALKIEDEKAGFNASLDFLQAMLTLNSMPYSADYPYFANTNWTPSAVGPAGGNGKNNLGAAFNFSLLKRETGAFAHNRYYAKVLLFDSIDYLQHGSVTGTINFSAYSSASTPVSTARNYLYSGGVRPL